MSKFFNIGIGIDNDPLKQGMQDAASIVSQQSQAIADAAVKGGDAIEKSHGKATASVKTIRQELRQAQKDAELLAQKYGDTSKEALAQSRAVAELKDRYDDFREKIDAFHPDGPFKAIAGAAQGATGGIAATQGAMALFGVESEATQQALLKVQAAMALSQGISDIRASIGAFEALGAVISTTVIPSLTTLKGALIATGIGAIVVALGTLVVMADQYNDQIEREIQLTKDLEELKKRQLEADTAAKDSAIAIQQLRIEAMADGMAKDIASAELRKRMRDKETADWFEKSSKESMAQDRVRERNKLSDQILANERAAISKKYNEQSVKEAQESAKKREEAAILAIDKEQFAYENAMSKRIAPKIGTASMEIKPIFAKNILGDLPEQLKKGLIEIDKFKSSASAMADDLERKITNSSENLSAMLQGVAIQAMGSMATMLGQSFAGVDVGVEQALGTIADTLGNGLIAIGTPLLVPTPGLGAAYIGAGLALKAIAGYMGGRAASGGASNSSGAVGGGYDRPRMDSPNFDFSRFGQQSTLIQLDGVVRGSNLVLAVNNTNQQKKRIR